MNIRKLLAIFVTIGAAVSFAVFNAAPAQAAISLSTAKSRAISACGGGGYYAQYYHDMDRFYYSMEGNIISTVFILYNPNSGYNCAVNVNRMSGSRFLGVAIKTTTAANWQSSDSGTFSSYAGPVKTKGDCMKVYASAYHSDGYDHEGGNAYFDSQSGYRRHTSEAMTGSCGGAAGWYRA